MTLDDLRDVLTASFRAAGWADPEQTAARMAEDLVDEADSWPEGTELRRVQPDDELVPA